MSLQELPGKVGFPSPLHLEHYAAFSCQGPEAWKENGFPPKISKTTYLDTSHHEHFMTVTVAKKEKKEHMFVAKTKL